MSSAGFVPCRARQAGVGGGHGQDGVGGLREDGEQDSWTLLQVLGVPAGNRGALQSPLARLHTCPAGRGPGSRQLQGRGPRSGGEALVCVGGSVPGSGRAGTKGQCPAPCPGGLPGAELLPPGPQGPKWGCRLRTKRPAGIPAGSWSLAPCPALPPPPSPPPPPHLEGRFPVRGVEVAIST